MALPCVTVIGNLTRPAELRYTAQGKAVTELVVAASDRRLVNGHWETGDTVFLPVSLWGSAAEQLGRAEKGSKVMVCGKLVSQSWETSGGERRSRVVVQAWDAAEVPRSGESAPGPTPGRDEAPPF